MHFREKVLTASEFRPVGHSRISHHHTVHLSIALIWLTPSAHKGLVVEAKSTHERFKGLVVERGCSCFILMIERESVDKVDLVLWQLLAQGAPLYHRVLVNRATHERENITNRCVEDSGEKLLLVRSGEGSSIDL